MKQQFYCGLILGANQKHRIEVYADSELFTMQAERDHGYKVVAVLTSYDAERLADLSIARFLDLVDMHGLSSAKHVDIDTLGSVECPPKIITREHVQKLVTNVQYMSAGLSMVCVVDTVFGHRVVGEAHAQNANTYQDHIGRECSYDSAFNKLFDLEVYRSKAFHHIAEK